MLAKAQFVNVSDESKVRPLSRKRMAAAMVLAAVADILQFSAGPIGWAFFDEAVDVVVMFIMIRLLGFHWLFLPTFALEFIPGAGMLPTWTGCVLWVVRLRNKQQKELQANAAISVENPKVPPPIH